MTDGEGTEPAVQVVMSESLFEQLRRALREQRCRLIIECGDGPRVVMISQAALARAEEPSLEPPSQEVRLTQREMEVLGLAATGRTSEQIGVEVGISRNTVVMHLATVRRKLGVSTTRAAVEHARCAGLLR